LFGYFVFFLFGNHGEFQQEKFIKKTFRDFFLNNFFYNFFSYKKLFSGPFECFALYKTKRDRPETETTQKPTQKTQSDESEDSDYEFDESSDPASEGEE